MITFATSNQHYISQRQAIMKQLFGYLLCTLFTPLISNAQYIVKGQLVRSDSTAIEHAVVLVMHGDMQYHTTASTDKNGEFTLNFRKPQWYALQFTSGESKPKFISIEVKDKETVLPVQVLTRDGSNYPPFVCNVALESQIESHQSAHTKRDKVSVWPGEHSVKQSGSIAELLSRILHPNYTIDTEAGTASIFGKKVIILNNGKRTTPEWLKSTPAEVVKRVNYTIIDETDDVPDSIKVYLRTRH